MSKRQPKSGSSQRRQPCSGVERSTATPVPAEARGQFQNAMKVASGFPMHSKSSIDTMHAAFTSLTRNYGPEVVAALIVEVAKRKPTFGEMLLCDPAFSVFAEQRCLREAKRLMVTLGLKFLGRMSAYAVMGMDACEEDRATILAEMRALTQRAGSWNEEYDAHYWMYHVSRDATDARFLHEYSDRRFAGLRQLNRDDASILLGVATLSDGFEELATAICLIERFAFGPVLQDAESHMWAYLITWDRARLTRLAEAIQGSRYVAEVRRLAVGARELTAQQGEEE